MTVYSDFVKANFADVKAELGGAASFAEVSKKLGEMYRAQTGKAKAKRSPSSANKCTEAYKKKCAEKKNGGVCHENEKRRSCRGLPKPRAKKSPTGRKPGRPKKQAPVEEAGAMLFRRSHSRSPHRGVQLSARRSHDRIRSLLMSIRRARSSCSM